MNSVTKIQVILDTMRQIQIGDSKEGFIEDLFEIGNEGLIGL